MKFKMFQGSLINNCFIRRFGSLTCNNALISIKSRHTYYRQAILICIIINQGGFLSDFPKVFMKAV